MPPVSNFCAKLSANYSRVQIVQLYKAIQPTGIDLAQTNPDRGETTGRCSNSSESSSGSRSSGPVVAVVVLAMSVENAQLEGVKSQEAPQAVRGGASRSPFC